MAKKIDFTPHHQEPSADEMTTDFFELLRAVVDGDEEAREHLRTILDMFDKQGFVLPSVMMQIPGNDDKTSENANNS